MPSPQVNLPAYTQQCGGSVLLDATNTGASYLWSNGATTATLNVSQTATLDVLVSLGACSARDTAAILIQPTANHTAFDTTLCAQTYTLQVNGSPSYVYIWRDSAVGGSQINNGMTYTQSFIDTSTYYVRGYAAQSAVSVGYPMQQFFSQSAYSAINDTRGLRFDVSSDIMLDSVTIYVGAGVVNSTIQLKNTSGQIFANKAVSLSAGANRVAVGFFIAAGTNYEIVLVNPSGGGTLYYERPVTFPLNYPYVSITLGAGITNRYHYFYNWSVRPLSCGTAALPYTVNVLPSPQVNLPTVFTGCGGTALVDVTQSNSANYLWSTGATTSSVSLTQNGTYSVSVSMGVCSINDTIDVVIYDSLAFSVADVTNCGGLQQLTANNLSGNGKLFWWSAATGGNLYNVGNDFDITLFDTTTFYVEGATMVGRYHEGANDLFTLGTSIAGYYNFNDTRGMIFDVLENVVLDSVTLYVNTSPVYTTIRLLNSSGAVLNAKEVVLMPGTNKISLDFYLPTGSNYRLQLLTPIGAGGIYYDGYVPYPLNYNHVILKSGTTFSGQYYFYDWVLSDYICPTTRKPMQVNILPTAQIDWPQDSVLCGTNAVIDVSNPNASYQWSTGSTSASINLVQSDTVSVTVTIGSCVSIDTMEVILTQPPTSIQTSSDTLVCEGNIVLHASGDGYTHLWYSSQNATQPIAVGDSASFFVTDTTTYWVEGVGFLMRSEVFNEINYPHPNGVFSYIQSSNYPIRGNTFTVKNIIILEQVSVYTDSAAQMDIVLKDKYGFELYRKPVVFTGSGQQVISLGWLVNPDVNYQLEMQNVQGGKIYLVTNYGFPLIYDDFEIRGGSPLVIGNNSYFSSIRISRLGCATNRLPILVNVPERPLFSLIADTAVCNSVNPMVLQASATNANYAYLWSTGATTNSISVSNSGTYTATITNGGLCSDSRDVFVQYLNAPNAYNAIDTTICNSSTVDLLANPNDGILLWYNVPNTTGVIHLGAPYHTYIQDTTDFRLEVAAKATTRIGDMVHPSPNQDGLYQSFIIPNSFDVHLATILDSVAVYLQNAPRTFDIELKNNQGQVIATKTVTVNTAKTKVFIPLGFVILPGNGYQLQFSNINSNFLVNTNSTYPMTTSAGIATLTGTSLPGVVYNCFYDWHFSYALSGCTATNFDTFRVNVSIPLNLYDSLFTCDSIALDASNGAAISYMWSNGMTGPIINVNTAGTYIVTMTDGATCTTMDTTLIATPNPISFPVLNGTVCDTILTTNYTMLNAASFLWGSGATTETIVLPAPGLYTVTIVNNQGCVLSETVNITQIEQLPASNPVLIGSGCYSDTLMAGLSGPGYTYLWNTGATTEAITVTNSGLYNVTVSSANGCMVNGTRFVSLDSLPAAAFSHIVTNNSVSFQSQSSSNTDYVLWDFGDNTSTSFLNPFHLYTNNGCYEVTLIAYNACGEDTTKTWVAINVDPLTCGITSALSQAPQSLELRIAPNPNQGQFRLLFEEALPVDSQLEIFDLNGRVLYQQNIDSETTVLELSFDFPSAMYLMKITTAKIHVIKPFVILKE